MSNNNNPATHHMKTNRPFAHVWRYAWIVSIIVGTGGLFLPYLGLLVPFIMAALIGMSLFKGKYWCGNFCPHGSFFENLLQPVSRRVKFPEILRSRGVIAVVLLIFMYMMTSRFIQVYAVLGTGDFLARLGLVFANTYLMVLLIGGLLAAIITPRTWCQFCPMGTMQALFYKLGQVLGLTKKYDRKVTLERADLCRSCGKCSRACPMQLAPHQGFSHNLQFEDERCIRCYTCVNNCPANILCLEGEALPLRKGKEYEGA